MTLTRDPVSGDRLEVLASAGARHGCWYEYTGVAAATGRPKAAKKAKLDADAAVPWEGWVVRRSEAACTLGECTTGSVGSDTAGDVLPVPPSASSTATPSATLVATPLATLTATSTATPPATSTATPARSTMASYFANFFNSMSPGKGGGT